MNFILSNWIAGPLLLSVMVYIAIRGRISSSSGNALRTENNGGLPANRFYVEGKLDCGKTYSCSFIEFDERGDFLDFRQHRHCRRTLESLSKGDRKVLTVVYCHGWKNGAQSGDVVQFLSFLGKLTNNEDYSDFRIHGIYLGWRGNLLLPYVDVRHWKLYQKIKSEVGGEILDHSKLRRLRWVGLIAENLSYWNRKAVAEHKASGLPLARAIYTYASSAKSYGKTPENLVFVVGHSFGALMLEKSLGQAMIGTLTKHWWQSPIEWSSTFDAVLFVNSAAPAIYAKEMRDFLVAHRRGLGISNSPHRDVPVILSLTSTADRATGTLHRIGNLFSRFSPSLQRCYVSGVLRDPNKKGLGRPSSHPPVRQSEFYARTPGHCYYLINHRIVQIGTNSQPVSHESAMAMNVNAQAAQPQCFVTSSNGNYSSLKWEITKTSDDRKFERKDGLIPTMQDSNYWIITCDGEIINGHNDIWSNSALETYAALFRLAVSKKRKK